MKNKTFDNTLFIKFLALLVFILTLFGFIKNSGIEISNSLLTITILIVFFIVNLFVFIKKINKKNQIISAQQNNNNTTLIKHHDNNSFNIMPSHTNKIRFDDIAGFEDIKDEIFEVVEYIKNPKKYQDFNVKLPKGILLVGPPGVGKTLLAKAIAHEAGVPFFYQSGATFVEMYVGMGAKKVVELFNKAKMSSPSIIFIDEIDAIGKNRDDTTSEEREATLNQLLISMDGFEDNSGTIIIAATNRIEVLDNALLRAGRFDKRLFLHLPTLSDRIQIFNSYLKKISHDIDIEVIASKTSGFSGAEIETLINEAALLAIKENSTVVNIEHLLVNKDKIKASSSNKIIFDEKDKNIVIIDKATKAIFMLKYNLPFDTINIFENTISLNENKILSNEDIIIYIQYYLIGYVNIELQTNKNYTYSNSDISEVKRLSKLYIHELFFNTFENENQFITHQIEECKKFITSYHDDINNLINFLDKNENINIKDLINIVDI